ncbi:MAG: serine hydrolase [Clostridia bacterium]|nr:serine hydrolase [Clostridia bacterium]
MNIPDFDGLVREIQRNNWQVFGLELWEDGKLTASFGDTRNTRYPIYSVTKSMVSLAAGMAIEDGALNTDDCVLRYLPGEYVRAMSEGQKQAYAPVTLQRLMTMSVEGFPFRLSGDDWLEEALRIPLNNPETRTFAYSNVPAYLTGVAVSEAVGERLDKYLSRRLFAPLGIPDPPCQFSPEGYFYGASGMELTVNELSRVGLTLSREGRYGQKQIVSPAYVREATSVRQMNREGGYGYFFWKYRDGFSLNGKWGQKCYVLPTQRLMITFLSHMEEGSDKIRECMERHLLDNGHDADI